MIYCAVVKYSRHRWSAFVEKLSLPLTMEGAG